MDLWSTQLPTEMCIRHISCGKGDQCVGLTILPLLYINCMKVLRSTTSWSPKGLSEPVMGDLYLYFMSTKAFILMFDLWKFLTIYLTFKKTMA